MHLGNIGETSHTILNINIMRELFSDYILGGIVMSSMESGLKFMSLGIVLEDKAIGDDYIRVTPIESLRDYKGLLKDMNENITSTVLDASNKPITSTTQSLAHIAARWIPLGQSNRISSPDVYANETVILLKYLDTEDYYWTTIYREPSLRGLEKAMYAWSNLKRGKKEKEPFKAFDRSTSYWVEVDTRKDKKVSFITNKNDGEKAAYSTIYDLKEGKFKIKDDRDNYIEIDTVQDTITITTNKKIHFKAQEIVMDASKSITLNTPEIKMNGSKNVLISSSDVNIGASKSLKISSPTASMDLGSTATIKGGSAINIIASDINLNGVCHGNCR